jgi:hypothetical protein
MVSAKTAAHRVLQRLKLPQQHVIAAVSRERLFPLWCRQHCRLGLRLLLRWRLLGRLWWLWLQQIACRFAYRQQLQVDQRQIRRMRFGKTSYQVMNCGRKQ